MNTHNVEEQHLTMLYKYLNNYTDIDDCCSLILDECPSRIGIDIESSSNTNFPQVITLTLPNRSEPVSAYEKLDSKYDIDTDTVVYLLQLSEEDDMIPSLEGILESRYTVKIGCDLKGDGGVLKEYLGCTLYPTVD